MAVLNFYNVVSLLYKLTSPFFWEAVQPFTMTFRFSITSLIVHKFISISIVGCCRCLGYTVFSMGLILWVICAMLILLCLDVSGNCGPPCDLFYPASTLLNGDSERLDNATYLLVRVIVLRFLNYCFTMPFGFNRRPSSGEIRVISNSILSCSNRHNLILWSSLL